MIEALPIEWGLPVKESNTGNKILENLVDNDAPPLLNNNSNIFKSIESALLWILNHEKEIMDAGYAGKGLYIRFCGNKCGTIYGSYSKGSYDIVQRHNTKILTRDELPKIENGSYYRYVPI